MADLTLAEAAERSGVAVDLLRKHAQRGKLRVKRDDNRVTVTEEDLSLYLAGERLGEGAKVLQSVSESTKSAEDAYREVGNLFGSLPHNVQGAILEGIPSGKRLGDSKAFLKATESMPTREPLNEESDDPHFGHPVGYQHSASPKWKRTSSSTWKLGDATWSWNGLFWEGGGSASGRQLDDGISPGAPASDRRPLAPSTVVKR